MSGATYADGFGGFGLGGMQLALPLSAIREVVPCTALNVLPCPAACVIGGIDLRGVVVPVVDVRIALGRVADAISMPSVIIMVHEGRLLGLLADAVTGVFYSPPDRLRRAGLAEAAPALYSGSLLRDDGGLLVSLLSPSALCGLPGVPTVEDPEPARQLTAADAPPAEGRGATLSVMLIRCHRTPLAIDAMAVHATVSAPRVEPSALAMGHCRGVIDYAGERIPAIDLMALCGLGRLGDDVAHEAFVVRINRGMVAFLVDAVVDIVGVDASRVVSVPTYAMPVPELLAAALPVSALPADVVERTGLSSGHFLLLDDAALKASGTVTALADITSTEAARDFDLSVGGLGGPAGERAMITYEVNGVTATPIDQISEVLPFRPAALAFEADGPMLGLLVHRGRSIPLMCLRQLIGGEPSAWSDEASILVVEADAEWVGFVVPRLRGIEMARWAPAGEAEEGGDATALANIVALRHVARFGTGADERLVCVIALADLARALRCRESAQRAA